MKKTETSEKTKAVVVKTDMSNGRVKLNRIIENLIRSLFMREKKLATVDELGVDGIFKRMKKEKCKLDNIIKAQNSAINAHDAAAKTDKDKSDVDVKELENQITEARKALQAKLEDREANKTAINKEKDRINILNENMTKFFTQKL